MKEEDENRKREEEKKKEEEKREGKGGKYLETDGHTSWQWPQGLAAPPPRTSTQPNRVSSTGSHSYVMTNHDVRWRNKGSEEK